MTPKDLPELPEPINYGSRGYEQLWRPLFTKDQVLAIQREAYELGARSTAAQPADRAVGLLREAVATLDMWADVAPAVSLRHDINRFLGEVAAAAQPVEPTGLKLVPIELTGAMWSAGRHEFTAQAQRWKHAPTSDAASVVADVAPGEIHRAMLAAVPPAAAQPVEPRVEFYDVWNQSHSLTIAQAADELMDWHNAYPGGIDEVEASIKRLAGIASHANRSAASGDSTPPSEPADGEQLWLWQNGDHFLAFRNLYPCYSPGGDPMTLGEPFGRAIFKHSHNREGKPNEQQRTDRQSPRSGADLDLQRRHAAGAGQACSAGAGASIGYGQHPIAPQGGWGAGDDSAGPQPVPDIAGATGVLAAGRNVAQGVAVQGDPSGALRPEPEAAGQRRFPSERRVARSGDMAPEGHTHLTVGLDSDSDVYVSIWEQDSDIGPQSACIEFCTRNGGGRSTKTREALVALMCAIEDDNAAEPSKKWPRDRTPQAASGSRGD